MQKHISGKIAIVKAWTLAVTLLLVPLSAWGWTPKTQVAIARKAADQAPVDLSRQISRHEKSFRRGILESFKNIPISGHSKNPDGKGNLDQQLSSAVQDAILAIEHHQPFEHIVYRLGIVAHLAADMNNPLNTDNQDRAEGRFYADYLRYIDRAHHRFAVVLYTDEPRPLTDHDVKVLSARSLIRGRSLYPLIGNEYRRIGFLSGVGRFDDRSTAFGVAAVSYSHAVSDIAQLLRYIWVEAGGSDVGSVFASPRSGLILLKGSSFRTR